MSLHASKCTLQTFTPFLRLQPHIQDRIYLYVLPFQDTISSFASRYTSGFRNPYSLKRLRLTCRLIDEEVLAVYCSNNSFMIQVRYNDNIHYPQKAYVQALEGMMFLRHVRNLVVEIMVGRRSALLA